jgi:hypothetical protein
MGVYSCRVRSANGGGSNGPSHGIEWHDSIGRSALDDRARHAPHDAGRFIFGQHVPTRGVHASGARSAIATHASKHSHHRSTAEVLGN